MFDVISTTRLDIPDHQTLISFRDDCVNEAFQGWLAEEGRTLFVEWYETNKHDYDGSRW